MSKSERIHGDEFLFDDWITAEYGRTEGFTALVMLISISNLDVIPLRSTFLHVVGDDLDWLGFTKLMQGAGVAWDGVMLMPQIDDDADGGPIADVQARVALATLEKRVIEDRMVINEGHFFDKWGRRMKIEAASAH